MRLGLLPGTLTAGGPGTYITGVVRELTTQQDLDVKVLLLGSRQLPGRGRGLRLQVTQQLGLTSGQVLGRPLAGRFHASPARALMPSYDLAFGRHDVYHQTHLDLDPLVPDDRLVVTLHDLVAERWPDEGRLLPAAERVLRRAAAIVTVSECSKQTILDRFRSLRADCIRVIPNGIDHRTFRIEPDDDERRLAEAGVTKPYLLCVGGLSQRKNLPTLLAAHRQASRNSRLPPLVLAGPWRAKQLQHVAGPAVRVLGAVDKGTVAALMRGAQAVVLPSRDEGFGLPLLEAQACGSLVLCSDIPAFREVGGTAPVFVESQSAPVLAAGLRESAALSSSEVEARTRAGLLQAARFSWELSAAGHRAVYDEVFTRRG